MPDRPTEDPPRWASIDQIDQVNGINNVVEPPEEKKDAGWNRSEYPAREWFNWFQRGVYQWLAYFAEQFPESPDDGAKFLSGTNPPTWATPSGGGGGEADSREATGLIATSAKGTGVTEALFSNGTQTIDANTLVAGCCIEMPFHVGLDGVEALDQVDIRCYLNGLAGTLLTSIFSGTGFLANDFANGTLVIHCLTVGATGTVRLYFKGYVVTAGVPATLEGLLGDQVIDTTAANTIDISYQFDSASATNDARLKIFRTDYKGC